MTGEEPIQERGGLECVLKNPTCKLPSAITCNRALEWCGGASGWPDGGTGWLAFAIAPGRST